MDREEAKKYLKELNSKIKYYGSSTITEYDGKYKYALDLAIESLENCDKELPSEIQKRLEKEKNEQLEKERNEMIKQIQDNCVHDWGPREWVYYTCYECKCKKCGKIEMFYERD